MISRDFPNVQPCCKPTVMPLIWCWWTTRLIIHKVIFAWTGTVLPPSKRKTQSPMLTFSGIGIYPPGLFSHIPSGSVAPLAPLLREQIALGRVSGEYHTGLWVDVGTPQRLQELDMQLRKEAHV